MITEVTEDTFNGFVSNGKPAFVYFWATWCQPCKQASKMIDTLSKRHEDIAFGKINVDTVRNGLLEKHYVESVPAFIFFKKGEPVATQTGLSTLYELEKMFA